MPATGLEPFTAKLISLNETVETSNDEVHHSSLICLVDELAHGLAVPEQVRMIVANVLHCWALENQMLFVPHCRGAALLAMPQVPRCTVTPASMLAPTQRLAELVPCFALTHHRPCTNLWLLNGQHSACNCMCGRFERLMVCLCISSTCSAARKNDADASVASHSSWYCCHGSAIADSTARRVAPLAAAGSPAGSTTGRHLGKTLHGGVSRLKDYVTLSGSDSIGETGMGRTLSKIPSAIAVQ